MTKDKQKSNKEIIIEEFSKFILENSKEIYDRCEGYLRADTDKLMFKIEHFATTLLSKLKVGKEEEIRELCQKTKENIFIGENLHSDRLLEEEFDNLISELSTPVREEGEVIAEGEIIPTSGSQYHIGKTMISVAKNPELDTKLFKLADKGKSGKLIFIEDKSQKDNKEE